MTPWLEEQIKNLPNQSDVMNALKALIESAQYSPNVVYMHYHEYVNSDFCRRIPRKLKKRLKLQGILK